MFDGAVTRCVFLQTVCFEKITTPLSVETRPCFFCNSGLITCLHLHDQQTLVQAFKSATILEKNEQFLCMFAVLVNNFWFYRCADHVFLCLWNVCVKLLLFSQDFILILSSHVIQFGLFSQDFYFDIVFTRLDLYLLPFSGRSLDSITPFSYLHISSVCTSVFFSNGCVRCNWCVPWTDA